MVPGPLVTFRAFNRKAIGSMPYDDTWYPWVGETVPLSVIDIKFMSAFRAFYVIFNGRSI